MITTLSLEQTLLIVIVIYDIFSKPNLFLIVAETKN
jgi:hypothetical protein